jgi:hypothetical protein
VLTKTWLMAGSLGTHVRTPASSTLDVTAASWSGCTGSGALAGCTIAIAPTGLPWTATGTSFYVDHTIHAVMTFSGSCSLSSGTAKLDGTIRGTWNASTHTVTFSNATGLVLSAGGMTWGNATASGSWRNPTQTLTLI